MKTYIYFGAFLSLLLLTGSCGRSGKYPEGGTYLPDLNMLFEDYDQLDSTGNYAGFANRLVLANRDLQSSELYIEAASLYDQAGNTDSVIILVNKAIDRGMANPYILSKFPTAAGLSRTASRKALQSRLDSIQVKLQKVSNFSLELSAMDEFWPYYDRALKDTSKARQQFRDYIFKGPRQLRDYYSVRYLSVDAMYGQMINASPRYYRFLKKQFDTNSVLALKDKTSRWMERFKEMYPQAVFPKVYVVPGLLNSGGTATEMGLFVGGDMYGKSENTPKGELTNWQREAIMEVSTLPALTLHELMHFQQNYHDPANVNNVLFNLVQEGVCDLLVELCSGEPLANSNLEYLENPKNREKILKDLREELYSEDLSNWLYNGGSIQDRPHDLGYTLGYLITRSYYLRQADKQRAIYELLNSSDLNAIVKDSEYAFLLDEPL